MTEINPTSNFYKVEGDTATIYEQADGVREVSVSITISAKPLGGDAFIKLEEVYTFSKPVNAAAALIKREEISEILRDQALAQAQTTADFLRKHIAERPTGNVSIHSVAPTVLTGTQAGASAEKFGAAATVAVANGASAPFTGGLQWGSVKSKFGEGELRFVLTSSQSTDQLKDQVLSQLKVKGLNPDALVVWDNRTGARGLEAGVPAGCVAAVKIGREAQDFVSPEIQGVALARAKHNSDGTLYVWLTKEGESALKFGALDKIKV